MNQVPKPKKNIKSLAKRKADENSKYWKAKLQKVFWDYIDLTQSNYCAVGEYMGESCKGNIERHHLIRRNHKKFEFDENNIIKLCSLHHKFSTRCSAHKAPLEFSYFLQKKFPGKWKWYIKNRNKITQKYERKSYKQLYNYYFDLLEKNNGQT